MSEMIIAFGIWCIVGFFFIGLGIYAVFSKKPVGFWANAEMFQVTDIKKYNKAMCKLYCVMGVVFMILGLPLLLKNLMLIIFSSIGVMIEVIVAMVIYITVIEKKYKKLH